MHFTVMTDDDGYDNEADNARFNSGGTIVLAITQPPLITIFVFNTIVLNHLL